MTITAAEQSRVTAGGSAIDPAQRTVARVAGVLFILTFITAIAARILFDYLAVKGFRASSHLLAGTRSVP